MAGLDDPRMHGSHGHLEHAFTGDRPERVKITCRTWHHGIAGKVLAKGPGPLRPIVMEGDPHRVRMAFGVRPKTSMTSRSNQFATGYFAAIEGTMVHSEAPGPRPGGRIAGSATTTVVHEETAARVSLVAREERQEPSAQTVGDAVGEIRQRGRGRLEQKLAGPGPRTALRQSQRS